LANKRIPSGTLGKFKEYLLGPFTSLNNTKASRLGKSKEKLVPGTLEFKVQRISSHDLDRLGEYQKTALNKTKPYQVKP
jgi:hypothetical protein